MNDGLFIIDCPPRPSTDDANHARQDGPTLVLAVDPLSKERAQAIVDEHNKLVAAVSEWAATSSLAAQGNQEAIPKMAAADRKLLDFVAVP